MQDDQLSRTELIQLVERLLRGEGTEDQQTEWLALLQHNVPDPGVARYIYYYDNGRIDPNDKDLSAEEIIDRAFAYKSIQL